MTKTEEQPHPEPGDADPDQADEDTVEPEDMPEVEEDRVVEVSDD